MFRNAELSDRLSIIGLLKNAHVAAKLPFAFSAAHASAIVAQHIADADRLALVLAPQGQAKGILLASVQSHPFAALKYAFETVWWIEPAMRGKGAASMLKTYETWAVDQGCSFAGMAALSVFPRVAKMYERCGFVPIETHYLKQLKA